MGIWHAVKRMIVRKGQMADDVSWHRGDKRLRFRKVEVMMSVRAVSGICRNRKEIVVK